MVGVLGLELVPISRGGGLFNQGLEMPINVNTGSRADVMLIQALQTGKRGLGCDPN